VRQPQTGPPIAWTARSFWNPDVHRVRQISVRRERVAEVRQRLANYQALKEAIDAICALGKRRPNSRCRGRRGTPAEVVPRLLTPKHIRNWSYERLEREVRANLQSARPCGHYDTRGVARSPFVLPNPI
jgi:hypothetical protein